MAKLPRLTGKELAKIIEKFGFVYSHTTGSHMVYKHSDGIRTTIPHHAGEEIGPGLLIKINNPTAAELRGMIWVVGPSLGNHIAPEGRGMDPVKKS